MIIYQTNADHDIMTTNKKKGVEHLLPLLFSLIENEDDKIFIERLYIDYYPIMKKKAYEILHDNSIVDDIINESFIKLFKKIPLLRSLECGKRLSYIVNTVKYTSFNYNRKQLVLSDKIYFGKTDDLVNSIPDLDSSVENLFLKQEDSVELGMALLELSERDRNLLYYKYILELKDKEIGETMNIPVNNIRQYLTRARRRALKIFQKRKSEK